MIKLKQKLEKSVGLGNIYPFFYEIQDLLLLYENEVTKAFGLGELMSKFLKTLVIFLSLKNYENLTVN